MEHKKIIINQDAYIRYINRDDYELHIRTCGPNGAWVFKFKKGNLKNIILGEKQGTLLSNS